MPEHRIRLNRAWEIRAVPLVFSLSKDATALQTPVDERFDLPLEVDGEEPIGDDEQPARLVLTRWFNAPSNLKSGQVLRVDVEPASLLEVAMLNGELIDVSHRRDTGATTLELTDKLQRHNRLDILIAYPPALSQASIALVIHDDGPSLDFDRFAPPQ